MANDSSVGGKRIEMTIMGLDSDQCLPIANYFCVCATVAKPLFHTDNSNIVDQLKESRVEREQNFSNFSKRQSEATAAVASENPSRG